MDAKEVKVRYADDSGRRFRVEAPEDMSMIDVMGHPGLPRLYSPPPRDYILTELKAIILPSKDGVTVYEVEAVYGRSPNAQPLPRGSILKLGD